MDRHRLVGIALVILSAFAFGAGGLFAKPAYAAGLDWLTFLAWRFAIGAALAWAALLVRTGGRQAIRALPRRTAFTASALGVLYVGNAGAYYAALETVPLALGAIIVYVYPPIVAVLASRFGQPLRGLRSWGALGLALVGVVLAVGGIDPGAPVPIEGLLLALAAPVIYAVWIVLSARVGGERRGRTGDAGGGDDEATGAGAQEYGALAISSTAVALVILALATRTPLAPASIPADAWIPIVGIGVISTFVAILTFYAGTRRVGAAQASLLSTVEPVFTITLAALILGDRLEPVQLLGAALILVAVLIAQTGRRAALGTADAGPAVPAGAALADD